MPAGEARSSKGLPTLIGALPLTPALGLSLSAGAQAAFPLRATGKIAFTRASSGTVDLWVMNATGSGMRNLTRTASPVDESVPAFSPNGRRIAFTLNDGSQTDIWV